MAAWQRPRTGDAHRPSRVVAERRDTRRAKAIAGDLDTIALKALAHDPARRYGSIAAFADDLKRYLDGRPVRARPDSQLYRLGKFARRHRVAMLAATLVAASLVAGLSAALWQGRRATANAVVAAAHAQRAERVKEFLIGLFEAADPEQSGGNVPARELLEQAGKRLESELAAEPLIRADLLEAVARIDRSMGLLEPAASLAEKALAIRAASLPADDPAVAAARATLGMVHVHQGKLDTALDELAAALASLEATEPANSLLLARVRSDYSNVLFWKGRSKESEPLERQVWETYAAALGPGNLQTAIHQRNLAVVLDDLDRVDEAESAYRASQTVIEQLLGNDHPARRRAISTRGAARQRESKYERRRSSTGARSPSAGPSSATTMRSPASRCSSMRCFCSTVAGSKSPSATIARRGPFSRRSIRATSRSASATTGSPFSPASAATTRRPSACSAR
jgi:serine/threonine-protein kinase